MNRRYPHLWLDLDQTLYDFKNASRQALQATFTELQIPYVAENFLAYEQCNHDCWTAFENREMDAKLLRTERFRRFFERIGYRNEHLLQDISDSYLRHIVEFTTLLPGAIDFLKTVGPGRTVTIITNGLREAQRPRLAMENGIAGLFDHEVISDEIGVAKPDPGFFNVARQRCGAERKADILIVGDSLNSDIRGGLQYGVDTLWFNWENKPNDSPWQPTYERTDFEQIIDLLSTPAGA